MKLSEVKTCINLSVGEGFYKFFGFFLYSSLLAPLPQIGLLVVLNCLGEVQ
jgi:hypothetical protein